VPLHTPTVLAPGRARLARVAALAAACATAGVATVVIANDHTAPHVRTIAKQSEPVVTRYFDIEANKAANMRALGLHVDEGQTGPGSRYHDLEANKVRSHRVR
jgi:hypothetical protein